MRKEDVKNYITQSLNLLMKNIQYEKITMEMISKKSGLSRRTIYRYFPNKQAILSEYVNDLVNLYNVDLNNTLESGQNPILSSFVFIYNNSDFFITAYKNNLLSSIFSAIVEIVKKIISFRHHDEIWTKEYTEYYVAFTAGGIYRVLYEWLKDDGLKSPQDMYDIYKNVIKDLNIRMTED